MALYVVEVRNDQGSEADAQQFVAAEVGETNRWDVLHLAPP